MFPTDKHLDQYVSTIQQRSDEEILFLLSHFLIWSGTIDIHDKRQYEKLIGEMKAPSNKQGRELSNQYKLRLIMHTAGVKHVQPWEGITWILDLLPRYPKRAIEAVNAYITAHATVLPDLRNNGLYDAAQIIRARFIGIPGSKSDTIQVLMDLTPRDFEHLVEELYYQMGYDTELTPPQKDGGRDILASRNRPARLERLVIECKRYTEPIGVSMVRALMGVVSDEKINKGVLATTSRFTKGAKQFASQNPRIELLAGDQLIILMNEYLGSTWPLSIDRLIAHDRKKVREATHLSPVYRSIP